METTWRNRLRPARTALAAATVMAAAVTTGAGVTGAVATQALAAAGLAGPPVPAQRPTAATSAPAGSLSSVWAARMAASQPAAPQAALLETAAPAGPSQAAPGAVVQIDGAHGSGAGAVAVSRPTPGGTAGHGLPGVGPLPAGWVAGSHTVEAGGMERTYYVVEPDHLRGAVPVLVVMHGLLMTPAGILSLTGLDRTGQPAVIVLPAGWERSWNAGGCCGPAYRAGVDDVDFIRLAVDQTLRSNPAADPARVYALGFSNGGRMAYRLACELPAMFAGFAAVEAVPVQDCSTGHHMDVTIVAQQSDPLLSVSSGQGHKTMDGHLEPTVAATVARQAFLDACAGVPKESRYGQATVYRWTCAAGKLLTYVWYPGGAHDWRRPTVTTPGATAFVLELVSR